MINRFVFNGKLQSLIKKKLKRILMYKHQSRDVINHLKKNSFLRVFPSACSIICTDRINCDENFQQYPRTEK